MNASTSTVTTYTTTVTLTLSEGEAAKITASIRSLGAFYLDENPALEMLADTLDTPWVAEARAHFDAGRYITAVKTVRQATKMSLIDAKNYVDAWREV